MDYFIIDNTYYPVEKDILHYVQATERDQWDNFLLND